MRVSPVLASVFASALAAALAAPLAGLAQGASVDPSTVHAGVYKVEPEHTQITFTVSHLGLSRYSGRLTGASGSLQIDPARVGATVLDVTLPVASVDTPSAKLNAELKSPAWLGADRFPQAHFRSLQVVSTGPDTARIDGELTLHGVTRPVSLDARFVGAGVNPITHAYTVGFEGRGVIRRGDYGVKAYLPMIGDDVALTLEGAFEQSPAS